MIVSWHGIGDNVLLTPVLREYVKQNNIKIALTYLKRLPIPDLFKKCPYISEFIPVSDPWNDFSDINTGRAHVWKEANVWKEEHGYDTIKEVTMHQSIATHKMIRAAKELNVKLVDYKTEIFPLSNKQIVKKADKYFDIVQPPYVFVHRIAGNPPKNVPVSAAEKLISSYGFTYKNVIEYGSRGLVARYLPTGDIAVEMEVLKRCSLAICADSFAMHAAVALGVPTAGIFTSTPPAWVIPLHECDFKVVSYK